MYLIFTDAVKPEKNISIVEVLRVGEWVYGGKKIKFTEDDLKNIVKNFKEGIRPQPPTRLVVDYNHGSMEVEPEKSKAAGWVNDLFFKDGSLYARIQWTNKAREYILNDEFRYVSAEIDPDYHTKTDGKPVGMTLLAIALTNRPFIEGQDSISLAENAEGEREKLRKAAEARSKKYGIHIRDDGHLTKPSEYSDVPDDAFADPVNFRYPLVPQERAIAAYKYFSKEKNRAFYSPAEQKKIEARIKKYLPDNIAKNAFKGGEMEDKDILKLTEEIKAKDKEILTLTEENKKLKEENEKLKQGLLLSEANDWVNKMVNDKMILAKEKDMMVQMYLKDKDFAKKFVETRGKVLPEGVLGENTDKDEKTALSEYQKIQKYADEHNLTFAEAWEKLK